MASIRTQKLSVVEKSGYALGDMAANFVFQFMIALQLDFYTHTFGLTPAQAGTMLGVVGLGVAVLNPVMGVIADRTTTRWGKFRPWVLWSALPFGIIGVLTFTTPDLSIAAKVIYAWVTYTALRVVYIINNVPYASLTAVMTEDPDERTSISSYRQIAANTAGLIIASFVIPLVGVLGKGNDARGYQLTMGLLSIVSVIFFVICFFVSKERIQPDPQQKTSLGQDMADLINNKAFIMLFMATLFYFTAILIRGNVMLPYFRFVSGDVPAYSWFNGFGLGSLLLGVALSTAVSIRMGKLKLFQVSMILTGVFTMVLHVLPPTGTVLIIAVESVRQFAFGLSGPILWAMMGDVADYGEWKTGRRASGTVTSAVVFALWAGLALGGAVAGWLLGAYGVVSDATVQTARAQSGIVLTGGIYAGLAFLVTALFLFFYPLSGQRNREIADELTERRKSFAPSA
jgi:GPH family glycoside/pentoside/hexuronide:cation symporter